MPNTIVKIVSGKNYLVNAKIGELMYGELGFLHNAKVFPQKILINGKEKICQGHERHRNIENLSQIKETKET